MKPLTPAAMRVMANSARQLGILAPAVASIFDRLASDPAMSAVSSDASIDWITGTDTDAIAAFTAAATVFVNAVIDGEKAARNATRKPSRVSRIFSKMGCKP